jgi:hypothetical protein
MRYPLFEIKIFFGEIYKFRKKSKILEKKILEKLIFFFNLFNFIKKTIKL